MDEKPKPIESIDWRTRVATTIAEDTKSPNGSVIYSKGTPITVTTFVKLENNVIRFNDPSAPALFLNQSYNSYQQAISNYPKILELSSKNIDYSTVVFDYLENIFASIIFAFTALEAFSNEVIPDDFVYNFEEQTKKDVQIAHQYSKEQIERKLSISEKLANVLPIIFKIPSPKGTKIWEDFVELRRLRDRIIHMKGKDRKYSKADHMYPQSIWKELLKPYHLNYPLVSKNLILYFKEKNDHWLKYCPF